MPEISFRGAGGHMIEGRYSPGGAENAPVALVLHPHPQHGGNMNNRVVYELYQCFARRGFSVLRFNFRGVGKSQGEFADVNDALLDAASALDWLQAMNTDPPQCWVGGFSFGVWPALQLVMRRPEISGFVAVGAPVNFYDFEFLQPCPSSGLFLHGADDAHVPVCEVDALVERLSKQPDITIGYHRVAGADHFFKDRHGEIAGVVDGYLRDATMGVNA